ncbi:MAG: COX15/CtaA family protein [Acidobacteria bacterium]|nr:COX15/CtaA family protein [Acidobacteriota bacterium]
MTWLHRSAVVLSACTLALLLAGALVSSTGAGLALPGWPSLSPGAEAASGAWLQQGHRLLAALVALLTTLVAALAWRADPRPWMKGLAVAAAALVVAQSVYGGLAVVSLLPAYFSVLHAALAQLFFGLTVAMALFTSPGWLARERGAVPAESDPALARWALASTAAIYVQVLVGATMRHSYVADGRPGGLAIPDYPLAFGQVVPVAELGSAIVAVAFLHRLIALVTAALVAVTVARVYRRHVGQAGLVRPATLLALLVGTQILLGGLAVLSGMTPLVTTMHAASVGIALAASLVLLLRAGAPTPLSAEARPRRATDATA